MTPYDSLQKTEGHQCQREWILETEEGENLRRTVSFFPGHKLCGREVANTGLVCFLNIDLGESRHEEGEIKF